MLTFSRIDQDYILQRALAPTGSTGWAKDAAGFIALDRSAEEPREVAVAVFQRFEGGTAELHLAMLDGKFRRDFMETLQVIAFTPAGLSLDKVWAIIPEWNKVAQIAALRVGFVFEHRKRAGIVGGGDAIVLSMGNPARAPARLSTDEE